MVLKTTRSIEEQATAQWRSAWLLLPAEWREAIASFIGRDPDVAAVVLRAGDLVMQD